MKCPNCGEKIQKESNFCVKCGMKLKKVCKCWVIKKGNYDCGKDSCPGYGLFKIEKSKSN